MSSHTVEPIRVLLVDDHKSVLWGLEKLIDTASPSMNVVGTATRCSEALVAVDRYQPDIVLLDIDLEDDNGLDLLGALRGRSRPYLLILTGIRDPEIIECAMREGARGMVYKSEPAERILKAIVRVHEGEFWLSRDRMAKILGSVLSDGGAATEHQGVTTDAILTPAERRIIAAIVRHKGASNKVIASALDISCNTLRNHLASIYGKVGVHTRLDLFLYAKERGLEKAAA